MTHIRPLTTVVLPLALVLVTAAWTLAAGTVPSAWAFPAPVSYTHLTLPTNREV